MKHFAKLTAATAAMSIFAVSAQATLLNFAITGDYSANFQLDSDPTPDDYESGTGFAVWDVPGFPDAAFGVADVYFYSSGFGGGVSLVDIYGGYNLLVTDGAQLYTGPEWDPTLLTGTFALTEFRGSGHYSLTISEATAAVPEPASWAMMVGGFGLVGGAMRRRQTTRVAFQRG